MNLNAFMKNKFALLFISVLILVLAVPFIDGKLIIVFPFIFIILMLGVLRTISLSKHIMRVWVALGILATVLKFMAIFAAISPGASQYVTSFTLGALSCYCIFLGASILKLLSEILLRHKITDDTLRGILSVYLLSGIFFALFYRIVYIFNPSEFSTNVGPVMFRDFLYFSFTILTTIGYGDIFPLGPIARSLTTIEAMTVPIFLTILVFRMLGRFVNQSNNELEN